MTEEFKKAMMLSESLLTEIAMLDLPRRTALLVATTVLVQIIIQFDRSEYKRLCDDANDAIRASVRKFG